MRHWPRKAPSISNGHFRTVRKQDQGRSKPTASPAAQIRGKRQIALDLGLTDPEWRQLQETAAAHLTRGQGFLKHENWNEAVAELSRAADFKNYTVTVLEAD
jgi:hypothetical protein